MPSLPSGWPSILRFPSVSMTEPQLRSPGFVSLAWHQLMKQSSVTNTAAPGSLATCCNLGSGRFTTVATRVRYPEMAEKLRPFGVDVAILPINGRSPERRVAGNLSGAEAAQLANDIAAKLVLPCHFDMFEFNTASPEEFMAECHRLQQRCQVLRCGERWESDGLRGETARLRPCGDGI